MSLIKDGKVYRTMEEQVVHLTEKHEEQLVVNENVSRQLADLSVATNLGGYNLVRFAFQKRGTFYHFASKTVAKPASISFDENDYVEIGSGNASDIPAYGYVKGGSIEIAFAGDFIQQYNELTFTNVTKRSTVVSAVTLSSFEGTALTDYDPDDVKKQVFSVVSDLAYGSRTQYASFDLNRDGVYNFVFIGAVKDGENGRELIGVNASNVTVVKNAIANGSSVFIEVDGLSDADFSGAKRGDVYECQVSGDKKTFVKTGSILGPKGDKGERGEQGEQGLRGVQGEQGAQGVQGIQGETGPAGTSVDIYAEILDNPSQLPDFASAGVGEGHLVRNTDGATVKTDLYFKGIDGEDWTKVENWSGTPGPAGPQGPAGPTGPQGVIGPQGPAGRDGENAEAIITGFLIPLFYGSFYDCLNYLADYIETNEDGIGDAFNEDGFYQITLTTNSGGIGGDSVEEVLENEIKNAVFAKYENTEYDNIVQTPLNIDIYLYKSTIGVSLYNFRAFGFKFSRTLKYILEEKGLSATQCDIFPTGFISYILGTGIVQGSQHVADPNFPSQFSDTIQNALRLIADEFINGNIKNYKDDVVVVSVYRSKTFEL